MGVVWDIERAGLDDITTDIYLDHVNINVLTPFQKVMYGKFNSIASPFPVDISGSMVSHPITNFPDREVHCLGK